jgi:hypothetical protein
MFPVRSQLPMTGMTVVGMMDSGRSAEHYMTIKGVPRRYLRYVVYVIPDDYDE